MHDYRLLAARTLLLSFVVGTLVLGAVALTAPASAQEAQLGLPETPQNLQVLPADMSTRAVIGVMRGFAGSLGVRCIHCHVGDDPRDLSTVDFVSDEKDTKRIARVMMRMVQSLNDDMLAPGLAEAGRTDNIEVRCGTCHHGNNRPIFLEDALAETFEADGLDATLARYEELRAQFYGRWAYDFGERSLLRLAESLAGGGDMDAAMAVIDKNMEHFPDSPGSYLSKAGIQQRAGDMPAAMATLEACVAELGDAGAFCQQSIERAQQRQQ